ncbi:hypothetical protein [Clostridium haemolyticum]|uniref:hypothetical protein n=1 Tax=Clostridium haemolyticum TaxID=84025 RepID=UPI0013019714|nr:hypothetical protein [Clostridium haemolyticum]
MFTKVVGSSPTLPILISISIYALTQVGQGVVKATITNLITIIVHFKLNNFTVK